MKNIFILGIARSGKTTTASKIANEFTNYKIIPLDIIINAYQNTFNDKRIGYSKEHLSDNKLALLVLNIINEFDKDVSFIVEGDSILPEEYHQYFDQENNMCFFLTNTKSPNQKIEHCRQYDTKKDWSFHLSDQELLTQFEEDAKIQETIIAQAQKYDYPTIDVCKQREEKLEKVYQKIKKNLS